MTTIGETGSNGEITHEMSLTARVAGWSTRHRWRVVAGWVVIVIDAMFVGSSVGADTDIEEEIPGEAGEAKDLFDERFGTGEESVRELVVFSHPSLAVSAPEYEQKVEDLIDELRALRTTDLERHGDTVVMSSQRVVSDTLTAYDVGLPREESPFVAVRPSAGDVSFAIVTSTQKCRSRRRRRSARSATPSSRRSTASPRPTGSRWCTSRKASPNRLRPGR